MHQFLPILYGLERIVICWHLTQAFLLEVELAWRDLKIAATHLIIHRLVVDRCCHPASIYFRWALNHFCNSSRERSSILLVLCSLAQFQILAIVREVAKAFYALALPASS